MNYVIDWSAIFTGLAVLVALFGYGFLEWQRRDERRAGRRASAHLIGTKTFSLANHFGALKGHLASYPKENWETAQTVLPSVKPLIGISLDPRIHLDKAETALLIEMEQSEYLTEMSLLASRYESAIRCLEEYATRYDLLYSKLPPPSEMEGMKGKHAVRHEDVLRLRPHSIVLFTLIASVRDSVVESDTRCRNLMAKYHPMMKRHFPKEKFIGFLELDGTELAEPDG